MLKTWLAIYRETLRNRWAKKTSWAIFVLTWLTQEVLQIRREYMWFGSCPPEQYIFLSNIPLKLKFARLFDWVSFPTNQFVTLWNGSRPDPWSLSVSIWQVGNETQKEKIILCSDRTQLLLCFHSGSVQLNLLGTRRDFFFLCLCLLLG